MTNNLALIKDIGILFDKKVILWGAGSSGINALMKLREVGIEVYAFVDSSNEKWETILCNKRVLSLNELSTMEKTEKDSFCIIISSVYANEIFQTIEKLHIDNGHIYTLEAFFYSLMFQNNIEKIEARLNRSYNNYRQKLLEICDKLWYSFISIDQVNLSSLLFKNKPILIFQPGKVGSVTIVNSLIDKNLSVMHVHDIEWLLDFNLKHLALDFQEYSLIREHIKNKMNLKIITAVREPISRDISHFFQKESMVSELIELSEPLSIDNFYDACLKFLYACINKKPSNASGTCKSYYDYIYEHINYGYMFDWFDVEIKSLFQIDIFEYPFDKEKGYTIIKKDNIELLVYKLEKLSSLETVIGNFVSCEDFKLNSGNLGGGKVYAPLYKEFKESIQIPQSYIDFYYNGNPRMDHFYTEEEKQKFRIKWTKH